MKEERTRICWLSPLPGILFIIPFVLISLFSIILRAFFNENSSFSLEEYLRLFQDTYFQQVFVRNTRSSLINTLIYAVLGFPTSYYIPKYAENKGMLMALAAFPIFTSPVIHSFSWIIILDKRGIINTTLMNLGLIPKSAGLLYSEFSVMVDFVQLFLSLVTLSLIGVMNSVSKDLNEVACNPGATRLGVFRRIIFPLSVPGLVTGSVLVFTGCLTAYTTPQLLDGADTRVLATMIHQQAVSLGGWAQASTVAVVMTVVTIVVPSGINAANRKSDPTI